MKRPRFCALVAALLPTVAFANAPKMGRLWPNGRYRPPVRDKGVFSDLDARVRLRFPKWVAGGPWILSRVSGSTIIFVAGVPVAFAEKAQPAATRKAGAGDADGDGIPNVLDLLIGAKKTVLNGAVYSDSYHKLRYPGGDVPRKEGVCTDVVVRALRNAGIDLQQAVHRDIKRAPRAYRDVKRPDTNIDHRRVRTLLSYFRRHHQALSPDRDGAENPLLPGDIVFLDTMKGRQPDHIGIISDGLGASGYPLVINNWTVGHHTAEMDLLRSVPITHRFRLSSASAGLRASKGLAGLLERRGLTIPSQHHQLLLVVAPLWRSSGGSLRRFRRLANGERWREVGRPIRARLGRNGLGRGRGLFASSKMSAVAPKREGDRRSPAGAFALGTALGRFARRPYRGRWPYRVVDDRDRLVDDPSSPHYNTWRRLPANGSPPWRSAERLSVYRLAVVVKHNTNPIVAGAGSAIFLHTTDSLDRPTIGCTAMKRRQLQRVLGWLRPSAQPVLVQVPGVLVE